MQTIWLGGTDFRHEGKHVWHDKEGSKVEDGYTNWNSGQVDNIPFLIVPIAPLNPFTILA